MAKAKPRAKPRAKSRARTSARTKAKPRALKVQAVPKGYHTFTPYLILEDCAAAIDYYRRAFGATEIMRMNGPDGKIRHGEIQIGDSRLFVADFRPEAMPPGWGTPKSLGGLTCAFYLYVKDVDAVHAQAVAAGGTPGLPPTDQFYGDRVSDVTDPFGYKWYLATHIKDMTPAEMMAHAGS